MTPDDLAAIAARVAIAPPERLAIDVTTLLAHITTLTAERDAALSRATAAEALREAARECRATAVQAIADAEAADGDCYDRAAGRADGGIACADAVDALAAKGGAR